MNEEVPIIVCMYKKPHKTGTAPIINYIGDESPTNFIIERRLMRSIMGNDLTNLKNQHMNC